jgi:hypothetical protein
MKYPYPLLGRSFSHRCSIAIPSIAATVTALQYDDYLGRRLRATAFVRVTRNDL